MSLSEPSESSVVCPGWGLEQRHSEAAGGWPGGVRAHESPMKVLVCWSCREESVLEPAELSSQTGRAVKWAAGTQCEVGNGTESEDKDICWNPSSITNYSHDLGPKTGYPRGHYFLSGLCKLDVHQKGKTSQIMLSQNPHLICPVEVGWKKRKYHNFRFLRKPIKVWW